MSSRKPTRTLPSVEYLRQCFNYNHKIGLLYWKERPREHFSTDGDWKKWNTRYAGTIAGNITVYGYRCISIGHRLFRAPRIIWKLITGEEPSDQLDHKDRNRLKDSRKNLRPATQTEQNWNRRYQLGISGYRGVSRNGKRWKAQITIDGVINHLGTFDTTEEAAIAYERIARKLHGKFYRRA